MHEQESVVTHAIPVPHNTQLTKPNILQTIDTHKKYCKKNIIINWRKDYIMGSDSRNYETLDFFLRFQCGKFILKIVIKR